MPNRQPSTGIVMRDRMGGCYATREDAVDSARRAVSLYHKARVVLFQPFGPDDRTPYHHMSASLVDAQPAVRDHISARGVRREVGGF